MERITKLECGCEFHRIDVEEFTVEGIQGTFLAISIVDHKSRYSGKLYKKPRLLADVVLHPPQVEFLKSALQKVEDNNGR